MSKLNRRNFLKSGATLSSFTCEPAGVRKRRSGQFHERRGPSSRTGTPCATFQHPNGSAMGSSEFTHWGIYSVPAYGKNGTWYAHNVYTNPNSDEYKHHIENYGPLEKFGYKDFIPMFTGSQFDPDEWADLFKGAGARFAGPVAEHHDGFAMWDTKLSQWNAAKMGPKRDVVGELGKAYRSHGLKFMTAFHHAEHWFYFPTWDNRYDAGDPRYSGLYGAIHPKGALPDQKFLDAWEGKLIEVVDRYDPDLVWFDFGLDLIQQGYKKHFAEYYFDGAPTAARKSSSPIRITIWLPEQVSTILSWARKPR